MLAGFVKNIPEKNMTSSTKLSSEFCYISDNIFNLVKETQGEYLKNIQGLNPVEFAIDTLNPTRATDSAKILERFTSLEKMKVLEVGSGCGVTHVSWTKLFGINGYAIEPEGEGFSNSALIARKLLSENGLDPNKIINARGEELPFEDNMFDIVYSSNVLEHVSDPKKVITEAIRVVKKNGIVQIVCPNYLSYFDGHYGAFHPPIFSNSFFCWWMKNIYKKNPDFAKTIRTEINPIWSSKAIRSLPNAKLLGLGENIFFERMIEGDVGKLNGLKKLSIIVNFIKKIKFDRALAKIIIMIKGWTPLIISIKKV